MRLQVTHIVIEIYSSSCDLQLLIEICPVCICQSRLTSKLPVGLYLLHALINSVVMKSHQCNWVWHFVARPGLWWGVKNETVRIDNAHQSESIVTERKLCHQPGKVLVKRVAPNIS